MTAAIYTTGYTGKDISDLKPMLETLDAVLADIRFAPYSQVLHWRKNYLQVLLGRKYFHIPNLGNRTFKEDKITIQNLQLGIETVLNLDKNAVLMCGCEKLENCHRLVIAGELLKQGIETEEITDWKIYKQGEIVRDILREETRRRGDEETMRDEVEGNLCNYSISSSSPRLLLSSSYLISSVFRSPSKLVFCRRIAFGVTSTNSSSAINSSASSSDKSLTGTRRIASSVRGCSHIR